MAGGLALDAAGQSHALHAIDALVARNRRRGELDAIVVAAHRAGDAAITLWTPSASGPLAVRYARALH